MTQRCHAGTPIVLLRDSPRADLLVDMRASPGLERCGILLGTIDSSRLDVIAYVAVDNEATDAARAFHIPAHVVRSIQLRAERADLDVVGFCHSHPHGPARPSPSDLTTALPGYLHIIVVPGPGRLRGWRLREDRSGFDRIVLRRDAG
jgi:desampylase